MRNKILIWTILSIIFCAVTFTFSLRFGAVNLTFLDFRQLLTGDSSEMVSSLFWEIRFPRIVGAFAVGASLALAGTILQAVFSNPLVEPYTLGLSGAASLGMALSYLLNLPSRFGSWVIPTAAFLGALPILLFLLSLGRENRFGMKAILLSGVMISYVCSSLVTLILTAADLETMGNIVQWGFGSLSGVSLGGGVALLIVSSAMMVIFLFLSLILNALSLGEQETRSIGISPERWQLFFLICATILTAGAVSICGVIGFVGLLVPHVVRMVISRDNRLLVPFSWILGGTVVLFADSFGRIIILPREIPVGVIMGIVGGIFFFVLIQKKSHLQ